MKDTYINSGFSGNGIIVVPLAPEGSVRAVKVRKPSIGSLRYREDFYPVAFPPEPNKVNVQRAARATPTAIEASSVICPPYDEHYNTQTCKSITPGQFLCQLKQTVPFRVFYGCDIQAAPDRGVRPRQCKCRQKTRNRRRSA